MAAEARDAAQLDVFIAHRFLPWQGPGGKTVVACAGPDGDARRIIARLYGPGARIVGASAALVTQAIEHAFRARLTHDAVFKLDECAPQFSARRVLTPAGSVLSVTLIPLALYGLFLTAEFAGFLLLALLCFCYLGNILFRLTLFAAAASPRDTGYRVAPEALSRLAPELLPVYSILVPLYREANMLPGLIAALKRLDYPASKLDIKIILEEDDTETIAAALALRLDRRFELLRVPVCQPRTKPKACNYGLRFARGDFVVIYDAEDRPEPDQLLKAAAAFRALPARIACLQARLSFYNARENWLTRMFTLEYSGWFDFLLPGLSRFGFPIPLGGTSNHFRIRTLRALHAWDAFNVTEDADLGIRLARCGYRVVPFDSTTYEEAVGAVRPWIRQRSRWLKGYMQTFLVHWRTPAAFLRAVGWPRFLAFTLFIGGTVVTNLFSPFFWLGSLLWTWQGSGNWLGLSGSAFLETVFAALIAGNAVLTVLAMAAPLKRRWFHLIPYGATVFLYGLLISAAAYRALWQLATRPFYWEKTEHGGPPRFSARLGAAAAVIAGGALIASDTCHANPWLRERGAGEAIAGMSLSKSSAGFAPGGRAANAASNIHFEYGLLENLTFVTHSDMIYETQITGGGAGRFDTAWAGARIALRRWDNAILSSEAEFGAAGVYAAPWPSGRTALAGAAQGRFSFGQAFPIAGRHSFFAAELGWRWRGGPPADEALFDATLGTTPWPSALLMLQSFSLASTGVAHAPYRRYATHKLQLSLAQQVNGALWLQAGLTATVAGADQGNMGAVTAVWWRF